MQGDGDIYKYAAKATSPLMKLIFAFSAIFVAALPLNSNHSVPLPRAKEIEMNTQNQIHRELHATTSNTSSNISHKKGQKLAKCQCACQDSNNSSISNELNLKFTATQLQSLTTIQAVQDSATIENNPAPQNRQMQREWTSSYCTPESDLCVDEAACAESAMKCCLCLVVNCAPPCLLPGLCLGLH